MIKQQCIEALKLLKEFNSDAVEVFLNFVENYDGNDEQGLLAITLVFIGLVTNLSKTKIDADSYQEVLKLQEEFAGDLGDLQKEISKLALGGAGSMPMDATPAAIKEFLDESQNQDQDEDLS